jgi:hypothetical protein
MLLKINIQTESKTGGIPCHECLWPIRKLVGYKKIYNYICNQFLSPQKLWFRIPVMEACTRYNYMGRWFFSGYSGFLHQYNWPPRYNWSIVESGVKHHNINHYPEICVKIVYVAITTTTLCYIYPKYHIGPAYASCCYHKITWIYGHEDDK